MIRKTEQILAPERGARLGNFGVTNVNENETWVTVSAWMQDLGTESRPASQEHIWRRWQRVRRPDSLETAKPKRVTRGNKASFSPFVFDRWLGELGNAERIQKTRQR